jgi:hypothetical protein
LQLALEEKEVDAFSDALKEWGNQKANKLLKRKRQKKSKRQKKAPTKASKKNGEIRNKMEEKSR